MAVGGRGIGDVQVDESAIRDLATPAGPIARYLAEGAQVVTQGAKRRAPVSPHGSGGRPSGWLRSQIGWVIGTDGTGLYVDIASPATTNDARQAPYGLFQNIPNLQGRARNGKRYPITTTPHLVPALDDWPK